MSYRVPVISPPINKERILSPFSADSVIKGRPATLSPAEIALRPKIISKQTGDLLKYTSKDIPKLDIGLVLRKRNKIIHQRKKMFRTVHGGEL